MNEIYVKCLFKAYLNARDHSFSTFAKFSGKNPDISYPPDTATPTLSLCNLEVGQSHPEEGIIYI